MTNKRRIKNFDVGRFSVDNVQRRKNPIKTIKKKFRYDFDGYTPLDSKIGRMTVYADNVDEAARKAKKEIKERL